jgi:hypothetical protein
MSEVLPANTEMIVPIGGVEIDRGARFHGVLPFEDWLVWTRQLMYVNKLTPFLIGDTLNYGEDMYGEEYAQVLGDFGLSQQTIANYRSVCRRVPIELRHVDTLAFGHHDIVASLPAPEQERWLNTAEEQAMTREELRGSVREAQGILPFVSTARMLAEKCFACMQAQDYPGAYDYLLQLLSILP